MATLVGCDHANTTYVATADTSAYATVNGYPGEPVFIVKTGDVCEIGETVSGKVDAYTEIKCPNGQGWVLEKENFAKIDK
jgi:hypothetical protein